MNQISKYSPQTSIFTHFKVDEELPKEERAFATWKALLSAKRSHDGLFLVIGQLLKTVRDNKMYETLDYDNFSQFLASEELGFSREKAYLCIKTYEYYIEYLELDPERIGGMNISRLSMMVPILKKIDNKAEVVRQMDKMNMLRHGDFISQIKEKTDRKGKPTCYWSNELDKWFIGYHPNTCHLMSYGDYSEE